MSDVSPTFHGAFYASTSTPTDTPFSALPEARLAAVRALCEPIAARITAMHYEGCERHHTECLAARVLSILDGETR